MSKIHGTNVHILPDESLGGGPNGQILREYVEVERKANVGDKIIIVNPFNCQFGDCYTQGTVMTVTETDEDGDIYCGKYDLIYGEEYRTLEPTDIVRIREENGAEKRYRLVDRKAKVGEKVIVTDNGYGYPIGTITKCEFSGCDMQISNGSRGIKHEHYLVLEPVESEPTELTTEDVKLNPDKVVDMLANLAQRIVELERKINDMNVTLERIEHVNDRQNDEIDTLHANQRKLAEDTTNRIDRHSERIRELAEMIGERKPYFKTFKPEIHFRIDNDKTPEDLVKSILKALEEVGRR
jgi:hypothetical protein